MATGSILLTPGSAIIPDGSATNAAPQLARVKSSASAPAPYYLQLLFDASTEEWCCWAFRMPADFASALACKVQYKMASATSGDVIWATQVAAISDGDATDADTKAFAATANTVTVTVPGTAGHIDEASITMTSNIDNLTAGDYVVLRLARDADAGGDTATGDAELIAVALTYTTT